MKLIRVGLQNFRRYQQETIIPIDTLTAFVGKNDSGKTSILEACDSFFGEAHRFRYKLSDAWHDRSEGFTRHDANATAIAQDAEIVISCTFLDVPEAITLEDGSRFSLRENYLLNAAGALEIRHVRRAPPSPFSRENTSAQTVLVRALHPTVAGIDMPLAKEDVERHCKMSGESPPTSTKQQLPVRRMIWGESSDLKCSVRDIPVRDGSRDSIWEKLIAPQLPFYFLFRSDLHRREAYDFDRLVENALLLSIEPAMAAFKAKIEEMKSQFEDSAKDLLQTMVTNLNKVSIPTLDAPTITFDFQTRDMERFFRVMLSDRAGVPLSQRGSGAKRLLLLSLLRAQIEHQPWARERGIIYALDEPENSQHPSQQQVLAEQLIDFVSQDQSAQVILTTHNPAFAHLLPISSLRHLRATRDGAEVSCGSEATLSDIAKELGVLPDSRVRVLICVEGPNDVSFLKIASKIFHDQKPEIPDLNVDPRVAMIPLGGSTLRDWVTQKYLQGLNLPEIHLYDRDLGLIPKYQEIVDRVNQRTDGLGSYAALTSKRQLENYLHPDAICDVYGFRPVFGDFDDVPEIVAREAHHRSNPTVLWLQLTAAGHDKKKSFAKRQLNHNVVHKMTYARFLQSDPTSDLLRWFAKVVEVLQRR